VLLEDSFESRARVFVRLELGNREESVVNF